MEASLTSAALPCGGLIYFMSSLLEMLVSLHPAHFPEQALTELAETSSPDATDQG